VIFDIENLEFVGSSGITPFIQTLKEFGTRTDQKAHILKASSEFKKVMRAYDDEQTFEFSDIDSAPPSKPLLET
jgi:anti-anti-sigma regulatory factor